MAENYQALVEKLEKTKKELLLAKRRDIPGDSVGADVSRPGHEEQRKAEEAESKAKQEAVDEATRTAAEKKAKYARIAISGEKIPR
ncbi:MAG: hypothetical protein Q9187_005284 [Circinaria calcarea]